MRANRERPTSRLYLDDIAHGVDTRGLVLRNFCGVQRVHDRGARGGRLGLVAQHAGRLLVVRAVVDWRAQQRVHIVREQGEGGPHQRRSADVEVHSPHQRGADRNKGGDNAFESCSHWRRLHKAMRG